MRRLRWLVLLCALGACSDSSTKSKDSGSSEETDAGKDNPDGSAGAESALERPPGNLARPPSDKLPDDLKPPGFGK
jgi:hypothetical protein